MNKTEDLRIDFDPDSAVAKLVDEEEVAAMRRKGLRKGDFGDRLLLGKMGGESGWADGFILELSEPPENIPHEAPDKTDMDFDNLVSGEFAPKEYPELICLGATEATDDRNSLAVLASHDKSVVVLMNKRYFGHFYKRYENARFYAGNSSNSPITVAHKGKRVGLIMPYNIENFGRVHIEKRFPELFEE